MKQFIKNILIGSAILAVLLGLVVAWRLWKLEQRAKACFGPVENCRVLVLGDSHADASFVEDAKLGVHIAGHHSSPLNFSLMRLLEIERRGGLKSVKVCVVNFCYTTCGAWTESNQLLSAWYLFPSSLRHLDLIPIDRSKIWAYLLNYMVDHPSEMPTLAFDPAAEEPRPSILEQASKWVADELDNAIGRHFPKDMSGMKLIDGWEDALLKTIERMNEVCRRNGVQLVFFSSPLSEGYRSRVPEAARARLEAWAGKVKKLGIPYYDYTTSMGPEKLRDSNHVRLQCAPEFTKKFRDEVLTKITGTGGVR